MASDLDLNDPKWQLTTRVLNSTAFEKAQRLRSFLKFVCELELTGRHQEINEHQIGIEVFGRPPAYNPGEDSVVRSQARFLRQRLEEYFRTDGKNEPIRIVIPKGSYVPVFEPNTVPTSDAAPIPSPGPFPTRTPPEQTVAKSPVHRARFGWIIAISSALFLILCSIVLFGFRNNFRVFQSPENRFWNEVFDSRRVPVIVPADSTLILIEEITGQPVSFQSYLSRDYMAKLSLPKCITTLTTSDLDSSHYTSMADLNLVARVLQVPDGKGMRATIRYARDLSISEAKEENLILIGGPRQSMG